jgi:hypothetical protein
MSLGRIQTVRQPKASIKLLSLNSRIGAWRGHPSCHAKAESTRFSSINWVTQGFHRRPDMLEKQQKVRHLAKRSMVHKNVLTGEMAKNIWNDPVVG